jgi:hypothetical protein
MKAISYSAPLRSRLLRGVRHLFHFIPVLLGLCLGTPSGAAAEDEPTAELAASFPASLPSIDNVIQCGEFFGSDQVRRVFINCGTNQQMVLVPFGLRLDASTPGKVVLSPADLSYSLCVRLIPEAGDSTVVAKADPSTGSILSGFPGAENILESGGGCGGRSGKEFSFFWPVPKMSARRVRVCHVAVPAGWLEFSLVADPAQYETGSRELDSLMFSLRTNESGAITIVPVPPNS